MANENPMRVPSVGKYEGMTQAHLATYQGWDERLAEHDRHWVESHRRMTAFMDTVEEAEMPSDVAQANQDFQRRSEEHLQKDRQEALIKQWQGAFEKRAQQDRMSTFLQAVDAEQSDVFQAPKAPDAVFRPNHYARYVIEPATFIGANKLPFDVGAIIKYVCRYDAKNGRQDVEKAKRFCEMLLERIDREERVANGEDPTMVWREVL